MLYLNIVKIRDTKGTLVVVKPTIDEPNLTILSHDSLPATITSDTDRVHFLFFETYGTQMVLRYKRILNTNSLPRNILNLIKLFPTPEIKINNLSGNHALLDERLFGCKTIPGNPINVVIEHCAHNSFPKPTQLKVTQPSDIIYYDRELKLILKENVSKSKIFDQLFPGNVTGAADIHPNPKPTSTNNTSLDSFINGKVTAYRTKNTLPELLESIAKYPLSKVMAHFRNLKLPVSTCWESEFRNKQPVIKSLFFMRVIGEGSLFCPIASELTDARELDMGSRRGCLLSFHSDFYFPANLPERSFNRWGPVTDEYCHYPIQISPQQPNTPLHYYILLLGYPSSGIQITKPKNELLDRGDRVGIIQGYPYAFLFCNREMFLAEDIQHFSKKDIETRIKCLDYLGTCN